MVPLALHCPLTTSWPSLTCSPLLHNSFPLHCCPRPLLGILLDMEALHWTLYGSTAFNCSFAIWQHCCIYSLLYVAAANALKSPGIQCGILLLCSTTPTITSSTRRSVCLACSAAQCRGQNSAFGRQLLIGRARPICQSLLSTSRPVKLNRFTSSLQSN